MVKGAKITEAWFIYNFKNKCEFFYREKNQSLGLQLVLEEFKGKATGAEMKTGTRIVLNLEDIWKWLNPTAGF